MVRPASCQRRAGLALLAGPSGRLGLLRTTGLFGEDEPVSADGANPGDDPDVPDGAAVAGADAPIGGGTWPVGDAGPVLGAAVAGGAVAVARWLVAHWSVARRLTVQRLTVQRLAALPRRAARPRCGVATRVADGGRGGRRDCNARDCNARRRDGHAAVARGWFGGNGRCCRDLGGRRWRAASWRRRRQATSEMALRRASWRTAGARWRPRRAARDAVWWSQPAGQSRRRQVAVWPRGSARLMGIGRRAVGGVWIALAPGERCGSEPRPRPRRLGWPLVARTRLPCGAGPARGQETAANLPRRQPARARHSPWQFRRLVRGGGRLSSAMRRTPQLQIRAPGSQVNSAAQDGLPYNRNRPFGRNKRGQYLGSSGSSVAANA